MIKLYYVESAPRNVQRYYVLPTMNTDEALELVLGYLEDEVGMPAEDAFDIGCERIWAQSEGDLATTGERFTVEVLDWPPQ